LCSAAWRSPSAIISVCCSCPQGQESCDGVERCRHLYSGAASGPAAAALMRFSGMPKEARGRFPSLAAIFLPLACGYLLSYIFRTINGPLADELIRRFSLDAESLG